MINLVLMTQALMTCLTDVMTGGWDQPDYVFALRGGSPEPELEYLLQVPGRVGAFLPTLIELGLQAGPGVAGLVLVTFGRDGEQRICSAMGMRADRTVRVVTVKQGGGIHVQDELPAVHGEHDELVLLLSRLLRVPSPPRRAHARSA